MSWESGASSLLEDDDEDDSPGGSADDDDDEGGAPLSFRESSRDTASAAVEEMPSEARFWSASPPSLGSVVHLGSKRGVDERKNEVEECENRR